MPYHYYLYFFIGWQRCSKQGWPHSHTRDQSRTTKVFKENRLLVFYFLLLCIIYWISSVSSKEVSRMLAGAVEKLIVSSVLFSDWSIVVSQVPRGGEKLTRLGIGSQHHIRPAPFLPNNVLFLLFLYFYLNFFFT